MRRRRSQARGSRAGPGRAVSATKQSKEIAMPVNNRIAHFAEEVAEWRRDFHAHPELLYEVHRTAGVVADRLRSFGCDEVVTGIGRTGVVGVIKGRSPGSQIGRASCR